MVPLVFTSRSEDIASETVSKRKAFPMRAIIHEAYNIDLLMLFQSFQTPNFKFKYRYSRENLHDNFVLFVSSQMKSLRLAKMKHTRNTR